MNVENRTMTAINLDNKIEAKMRSAGVPTPTITAFLNALHKLIAGERGMLPESMIEPVASLPRLDSLEGGGEGGAGLLKQLAIIKLNGGLGTGMGLDRTKSLIAVKGRDTFLDFVARQVLHLRGAGGCKEPAFYLMNSFVTRQETLEYLGKYPDLWDDNTIDFLQNMVPRIDAKTFEPLVWPAQPELEWCPPGHGDFYPALLGSGLVDRLLNRGVTCLFISNSDNLGATVDLKLLRYFAESGLSFLMEVAGRTASDRKGGHLAVRRGNGRLLLRESAQCPKADEGQFQDIERHRFFNTNNLWIRLDHLKVELDRHGGALPLPLITNTKTADPRDPKSPEVIQLESAMGAAIGCFERTGAIVVPRARFSPVKNSADLLALRSDAYRVTGDSRLVLHESRCGQPPLVELDPAHYKVFADFEKCFARGAPSLVACHGLKISGRIEFEGGVVCQGKVEFCNPSSETKTVGTGTYRDTLVRL
jgi:UDP-N-acetylglucosamine pyrophosphorylase